MGLKRLNGILGRLVRTAKAVKKCYRDGGATNVNFSQINSGEVLAGKRVLITGGSKGIGLAIAQKCLSEGARVIITGRDASTLDSVAKEIGSPLLHTLVWDVSKTEQTEGKLVEVLDLVGGNLDVLVNNAGVISVKPFEEVTEEIWDRIYSINSRGLFFLTQAVSKLWIKNKSGGKIINVSSSGGFLGAHYPYRMTKWDIVGLTQGLGIRLSPHGIIVNGIAPGMTASDMTGVDANDNAYVSFYPPSHRVALPEEIAELALFLISDAANFIVGQTIICDGGYSLKV